VRKQRRILLIALAAAAVIAGAWINWPTREPVYHGKSLNYWLRETGPNGRGPMFIMGPVDGRPQILLSPYQLEGVIRRSADSYDEIPKGNAGCSVALLKPAFNRGIILGGDDLYAPNYRATWPAAVTNAGAAAVPDLLGLVRAKDTPLGLKLIALAQKQHYFAVVHIADKALNERARYAFRLLGPTASNAVPALIKIYKENISYESRLAAIDALGAIGPRASAGIPVLTNATASTNATERMTAAWSLGMIRSQPDMVIQVMFHLMMNDPDAGVRRQAAYSLRNFGPEANSALKPFISVIDTCDPNVTVELCAALPQTDPGLAEKVREPERDAEMATMYLEILLRHKPGQLGLDAFNYTQFPGPRPRRFAKWLAPAVIPLLNFSDSQTRINAACLLGKFGPGASEAIPPLKKALDDPDLDVRNTADAALQLISPGNTPSANAAKAP
jgi:HEAT repeat protein